jgi:acetylornithine/succinyldiaminopimelate/putrescine aminotransferase
VIREVRGAGLMRGIDLRIDAAPVIEQARQSGLLVNRTSETVVRLLPPLTIEAADIDAGIDVLDTVLMAVAMEVPA